MLDKNHDRLQNLFLPSGCYCRVGLRSTVSVEFLFSRRHIFFVWRPCCSTQICHGFGECWLAWWKEVRPFLAKHLCPQSICRHIRRRRREKQVCQSYLSVFFLFSFLILLQQQSAFFGSGPLPKTKVSCQRLPCLWRSQIWPLCSNQLRKKHIWVATPNNNKSTLDLNLAISAASSD